MLGSTATVLLDVASPEGTPVEMGARLIDSLSAAIAKHMKVEPGTLFLLQEDSVDEDEFYKRLALQFSEYTGRRRAARKLADFRYDDTLAEVGPPGWDPDFAYLPNEVAYLPS